MNSEQSINIHHEMLQYFLRLSEKEKKSVLQLIKTFLQGKQEPVQPINFQQYNKEIEEAMARIDGGEFTTQESLEKEAAKW